MARSIITIPLSLLKHTLMYVKMMRNRLYYIRHRSLLLCPLNKENNALFNQVDSFYGIDRGSHAVLELFVIVMLIYKLLFANYFSFNCLGYPGEQRE